MQGGAFKDGSERHAKRRSRARPDRIIEKRPRWQEYLDPEEDPGLLEEEEVDPRDGDGEDSEEDSKKH